MAKTNSYIHLVLLETCHWVRLAWPVKQINTFSIMMKLTKKHTSWVHTTSSPLPIQINACVSGSSPQRFMTSPLHGRHQSINMKNIQCSSTETQQEHHEDGILLVFKKIFLPTVFFPYLQKSRLVFYIYSNNISTKNTETPTFSFVLSSSFHNCSNSAFLPANSWLSSCVFWECFLMASAAVLSCSWSCCSSYRKSVKNEVRNDSSVFWFFLFQMPCLLAQTFTSLCNSVSRYLTVYAFSYAQCCISGHIIKYKLNQKDKKKAYYYLNEICQRLLTEPRFGENSSNFISETKSIISAQSVPEI